VNKAPRRKRRKFEVLLNFSQQSWASVVIEADSLAEARQKADGICSDEIDDWNPVHGELDVLDVAPMKGGHP